MAPDPGRNEFVAAIVAVAAAAALLFVFGALPDLSTMMIGVFILAALGFVLRRSTEYSIGYIVATAALLLVIAEYFIPDIVVDAFSPITSPVSDLLYTFAGVDIASVEPIQLFVVVLTTIFLAIAARYRITGQKKEMVPLVEKTGSKMQRYFRSWISLGRAVLIAAFTLVVIAMGNGAEFIGEVGNVAGEVPFVASNLFAWLAGFLSLGGELPFVGTIPLLDSLDSGSWAVLIALVILTAVAVDWDSSGPLTQFLRKQR